MLKSEPQKRMQPDKKSKKKTSDATLEQQSASTFVGGAAGVSGVRWGVGGAVQLCSGGSPMVVVGSLWGPRCHEFAYAYSPTVCCTCRVSYCQLVVKKGGTNGQM